MDLQEAVYCVHSFPNFFFCLFSSQTFQGHGIGHQFGLEDADKVSVRDCCPFFCSELNCVPFQKRYVEVILPSTSKCDLIWKYSLSRGNLVETRWLEWALRQHNWYPCKSGHRDRHTQKKDNVKRHREKMIVYNPRNPWGYQRLREAWNSIFRGTEVLLTPWYQTSGLQTVRQ